MMKFHFTSLFYGEIFEIKWNETMQFLTDGDLPNLSLHSSQRW